jgi:hypothetical protein
VGYWDRADRLGVSGANSNQLARRLANTKVHSYQGMVSVNARNGHNKNILYLRSNKFYSIIMREMPNSIWRLIQIGTLDERPDHPPMKPTQLSAVWAEALQCKVGHQVRRTWQGYLKLDDAFEGVRFISNYFNTNDSPKINVKVQLKVSLCMPCTQTGRVEI